jgi:hypothetical protein
MRTLFVYALVSFITLAAGLPALQAADIEMGQITCGQTQTATLTAPDEQHIWTFTGQAGDLILLSISDTAGVDGRVDLYPPAGGAAEFTNKGGLISWSLAQSGVYKIVAYDLSHNDTGGYSLTFENLSGCAGTPIACDETVTGELVARGDLDVYEFTGQAGDLILLSISDTVGVDGRVDLYPPAGGAAEFTNKGGLISWSLTQSGVYKIVAYDLSHNDTGSYSLTFENLSGCRGSEIYVDDSAVGNDDGTSWADAYNYLQDALVDAAGRDTEVSIYVAQGVYVPGLSTAEPLGTGDRAAAFELPDGVVFVGGYAGVQGDDPNARDVEVYETILSGDLLGNDTGDPATLLDNSLHVVMATGTGETTLLEGVTITGGNADGPGRRRFAPARGCSDGSGLHVHRQQRRLERWWSHVLVRRCYL